MLEACKRGSVGSHLTLALVSKAGEVTYVPLKVIGEGGLSLFIVRSDGLMAKKNCTCIVCKISCGVLSAGSWLWT